MGEWLAFLDALIIFKGTPSKDQEGRIFNIFLKLSHGRRENIKFEDRDIDGTVKRCLDMHFSFFYNRREMLNIMHRVKHIALLENGSCFEFFDEDNDTWTFTFKDGKFIEEGN
ncbi:MAG: hypothetical protein J5824_00300 [Lachnospiraceae bacterium]|nr:hypothetical protein [Lachnospiraceae bacterium]